MLTPAKITNHHFEASGRNAYKAEGVDSFIREVADSYEQMFRENGEMFKKINLLAQRLEEYKNDEDNIRNALLTAQRAADKITRDAQEKADKLVADVKERTDTENERLDAAAKEMLSKAKYQADSIIEQAQKQANDIVENAVRESKEASVNARSDMIKELAALETMKQEVTKFKQQILGEYNAQLELINKLPEVVIEQMTAEEEAKKAEEEKTEEEATAEDPVAEPEEEVSEPEKSENAEKSEAATEENAEEEAQRPFDGSVEEVKNPEAREAESMDVEHLQQMIYETEDTDAESDPVYEDEDEEESVEESDDSAEFVVPDIDDASDEELEKLVDNYGSEEKPEPKDIMFTKPKKNSSEKEGFKLKFENIDSYAVTDDDGYLDDLDDDDLDDDGNDSGFAGKLKGFFKK